MNVDLIAKNHPNSLNENISRATASYMKDNKLFLGLGVDLNF